MSILVLTSDTLIGTPATGNLEYNGQFYGTDSALSRAQIQRITQGTAVASTSGTSIDFTGLPAWVKRITVMFKGVSTNNTSAMLVQVGAGSVVNTGYTSSSFGGAVANSLTGNTSTAGFIISNSIIAANNYDGIVIITNITGNSWVSNSTFLNVNSSSVGYVGTGSIALGGTLDRVRITSVTPDTFDAGTINILYEG